MAKIIEFPGKRADVAPVPEPVAVSAATPQVEEVPAATEQPKQKIIGHARMPVEVFEKVMNALSFYAAQGHDHGRKAHLALESVFAKETA